MIQKHYEFDRILNSKIKENINGFRNVQCSDSRNLPCDEGKATLIVTSPPYVTSYEYADLHQLPSLWFGYIDELAKFRKKFIGSAYKDHENINLKSSIADAIVSNLKNKKQNEVKNYFADMLETFEETKRVLKQGGKVCIVIGNTEFQGVEILNAEVFQEQLENIGFKTFDVVKREIPSKMLPSTRDPETGRFGKITNENIKMVYPTEYILIMEKL
jgi:DNA modification methylase